MQYFSDEQLDDMFRLLDFDQLEQLGYKMDIYTPDELEDFMITIEEEFSELDRDDKIADLREIGAFEDDYLVDEVKMGAESANRALIAGSVGGEPAMFYHQKGVTDRTGFTPGRILTGDESELLNEASRINDAVGAKRQKQGFKNYKRNVWSLKRAAETKRERLKREREEMKMDDAATDVDYMRDHYSEEGSAPIQDPMEFGEMANWTPLDGSEGLKRKRAEYGDISGERMTFGTIVYEGQYESPKSLDGDQIAQIEDRVEREIRSTGDGEGSLSFDIQFVDAQDEEFEVTGDVSWHHEYSDFNTAETGTYASESDAYIYAYNDGHRDGRDMSSKITYQPSASDKEITTFKKIFKQAEHFAADSPFNTLLEIREDIIIDDEQDFDRLLSIYMSLETDIATMYQTMDNPKHPLLEEMIRYRNQIATRLDELQDEIAIQDTIEMDAENRRVLADPTVPIQLQQPLRTGYKLGLGWVAAALTIPLALVGLGAFYNQE